MGTHHGGLGWLPKDGRELRVIRGRIEKRAAKLAQEVVAALRLESKIEVMQTSVPGAPILRYVPETKRSLDELGLKQHIDLREAVLRNKYLHVRRLEPCSYLPSVPNGCLRVVEKVDQHHRVNLSCRIALGT